MAQRAGKFVLCASLLCALWFFYSFASKAAGIGIPCLTRLITGFYCPGCGTMRAITALASFDFYQALRYNAFFIALLPIIIYLASKSAFHYIRYGKTPSSGKYDKAAGIIVILFAAAYMAARNTQAFAFLAPTSA